MMWNNILRIIVLGSISQMANGQLQQNSFLITNQTGHDIYLWPQFSRHQGNIPLQGHGATGAMYNTQTNKTILKKGASKKITLPAQFAGTDIINITAFYSDNTGKCYSGNTSYNASYISNGLTIKTFFTSLTKKQTLQAKTQAVMFLSYNKSAGNIFCDNWYNNFVDSTASTMPADKP